MKLKIIIVMSLFLFIGCLKKNRVITLKLNTNKKERIILEKQGYEIYLNEEVSKKYLTKAFEEGKLKTKEVLTFLKDNPLDTIRMELGSSAFDSKNNKEFEIFSILDKILKSKKNAIFNQKEKKFEKGFYYYHNDDWKGEQITFSINQTQLFCKVISLGE